MQDVNIGLWDFALRLYKAPGVTDARLGLQERNSVDVPVLLFAAWLKQGSIALSPAKTEQIIGLVSEWRDEVIAPLRTVRQRLKTGPKPAPDKQTDVLRDAVKGAELSAERIELGVLETTGLSLATLSR
ncbi:TIGR02444 family protein [Phyllobacterium zundukense]|uniref:TIGR02444 family protein n=1 Tax=Phyllobacterium zundukense TaxID=1867719 RepID=A0A2N9VXX0_9HYPH|nr:TIGR02444 family protein [Phyllobacterium zundukense]ATU95659.1 TIGR02444 family protein [Phyllobacterium zundukense]PIO44338.1 TIGR02444 family protein [Phyllobacterium zundukense]